jgi:site-specific DNA-cytosine methylase
VRDFAQLDAADYGVPQHRFRAFWYGHLDGPCVRWPERTHGSPRECATLTLPCTSPLRPWVTFRDALAHLSREDLGRPVRLRRDEVPPGPSANGTPMPDDPRLAVTEATDGGTPHGSYLVEWPWGGAPIATARDARAPYGLGPVAPLGSAIRLSEKAAAILQGFPEGWQFIGRTKRSRWTQIGAAVPPPLVEAVGRSIHAALTASRPACVVRHLPRMPRHAERP